MSIREVKVGDYLKLSETLKQYYNQAWEYVQVTEIPEGLQDLYVCEFITHQMVDESRLCEINGYMSKRLSVTGFYDQSF